MPVVLETVTFLERNVTRRAATAWRNALDAVPRLRVHVTKTVIVDNDIWMK